jgi:hypothetical protein
LRRSSRCVMASQNSTHIIPWISPKSMTTVS